MARSLCMSRRSLKNKLNGAGRMAVLMIDDDVLRIHEKFLRAGAYIPHIATYYQY